MATFDLYLDLSSVYTGTAPTFEILIDGVVVSSLTVTSSFTPVTLSSLVYSGDAPGYLSFRFNDADGEVDRSITLNEVRINGTTVNGSSLDKLTVLQGQESQLDVDAEQASFGIPGPGAGTDAVINGTAGVDNLNGTSGNDTISGLGDRDWIKGNDGIDTIHGGAGHDIVRGGDSDDIINGDADNDLLKGEGDNDTINGGTGHDTLDGGAGDDALNGDDGNDVLKGGVGIDTLRGGNDNDKLYSGDDGDFIYGDAGNDKAYGDGGNDSLYGGIGNDTLFGGAGVDIVDGEDDHDRLYGDAGNDTLYGRDGNDKLFGGADNDTLFGGNGNDKLFGEDGDDIINGEDGNDRIVGGDGIDTINGGDGIDNIDGDDGNDIISGGLMGDLIKGGAGDDTINGDEGNDNLYGQEGDDTINGGDGNDYLYGKDDDDELNGGDGDDLLHGGADDDELNGDADDDILNGEGGNDVLDGGADDDVLIGGAGADTLTGGTGVDVLHGHGMWNHDVAVLLAANPSVVYNEETNSFYQYVSTAANYATALAAAQGSVLNGVAGHLVTITSAVENAYVQTLIGGTTWMSATDDVSNTDWVWNGGAEDGIQFSNGATAANNLYENWAGGQPQNNTEHNGVIYTSGEWHDWPDTSSHRYVIEWDAGLMNDDNAVDTLNGGDGNDMLYGYGGDDILNGDANNDTVFGGDGNDTIDGGLGHDSLFGQDGDDIITVFFGSNVLYGGAGSDTITGGSGTDRLYSNSDHVTTTVTSNVTLMSEAFAAGSGSFSYTDGGFGGSDGGGVDVNGSHITTDGDAANGSLEVYVDRTGTHSNSSGTWDSSITPTAATTNAQITFSYRHFHHTRNDTGEDSEVYFEFNGTVIDTSGGTSFLSQALGSAGETDTGWTTVTINLPDLTASTTYNFSIGILHSGSNGNREDAYVRIDDVSITGDQSITALTTMDTGETNVLNGGGGNDTLYGSAGDDTLNGGSGTDTIYSGSMTTLDAAVQNVLDNNAGVAYSEETNSFYQYVSTAATFTAANNAATSATLTGLTGVTGNLATITSQAEQDYVWALGGGNSLWGGANDATTEGTWVWQNGDDNGLTFWTGGAAGSGGSASNGHFENWIPDGTEPWGNSADYDYFILRSANGGQWWTENNDATTFNYVIEWDARTLIDTIDTTTLNGGSGADTLYASDGVDTFLFETATWDATDTIEDFSITGRDQIDISDLLTGYTYTSSNINDFVQLTESGGNTTIAVDANGTTGGSSYTDVAVLNGVTGIDLYQAIAADTLIVA
ncbi:MAG: type I secretion C-terminal target domain-containing protein [Alphaproteobacteria bacterium]|nr:type I secretion C-terminal target domain-containing protein [Alphaproteobacteria bacterium]